MDAGDISKWGGIVFGAIGSALGIHKFMAARKRALDERFAGLATKEQVERHKEANDEQVKLARQDIANLYRLNEKQNDKLDELKTLLLEGRR